MRNATYNRTSYLSVFQQRFVAGQSAKDVLHEDKYWKRFIPHENSGPCETYDPPFQSEPGYATSMYIRLNSSDWDPYLEIFLHEKNKFFYSIHPTYQLIYLDSQKLRATNLSHPRVIGNLYTFYISLNDITTSLISKLLLPV